MNTTIANRIYIDNPSDEVKDWVSENLCFPNPEFEKKQRMGFWTGRTPRELRLYEWNGKTLIIPFGVCKQLMPMLKGTGVFCDFRQNSVIDYGNKDMGLYDYQKEAVAGMIDAKYGILKSKPGSGKTQCGIALIKAHRRRALWLCHTADLLNQSKERALRYMDESLVGTITEGRVNVGVGVTFATVQTMANLELTQYRDYWDVIIVDECFPGNTDILTTDGIKQICDITKSDKVITLDNNGDLKVRKVKDVFRKKPESMVKVTLENGKHIYCTANHPILTERGYVNAGYLTNHDSVYCLREDDGHITSVTSEKKQYFAREGKNFLFGRMQKKSRKLLDGRKTREITSSNDSSEQENRFRKDEGTQPNEKCRNERVCKQKTEGNESASFRSWWKWKRTDRTAANTNGKSSSDMPGSRICYSNKDTERKRIPDMLQSGYRVSGKENRYRNRRKFPLFNRKTEPGHEERRFAEFVRVESVEVQKQTSDGTYGGLCPDGYVYNLHVKRNHNYFANGMNVHNCHRVSSSATTFTRYEKVLNHLAARHKYGLSATPERSDGLIKATFALLGNVAYEVPDSAVADKTMPVKIRKVDTSIKINDDCLNSDGTINYVKLIEYLTSNADRNMIIASHIMANSQLYQEHSCLVLSDRLDQLKDIMGLLRDSVKASCVYIDGKMTSKKAKAEREQALEDMRTGKKKILFASYSLAKEGLDVPRLDRLFLASPCKYSAIITQSVGRVQRTFPGKETPVVYDFVDNIGFCQGAWKKRCTSYRKMGAEIEER